MNGHWPSIVLINLCEIVYWGCVDGKGIYCLKLHLYKPREDVEHFIPLDVNCCLINLHVIYPSLSFFVN